MARVRACIALAATIALIASYKLLAEPKPDYMITERTVAEALLQETGSLPIDPDWRFPRNITVGILWARKEVIRSAREFADYPPEAFVTTYRRTPHGAERGRWECSSMIVTLSSTATATARP